MKELKSGASVPDQMHFLEEALPYRYKFPSVTPGCDPIPASQMGKECYVILDPGCLKQNRLCSREILFSDLKIELKSIKVFCSMCKKALFLLHF